MSVLINQIRALAPSAKEPLFRRLTAAPALAYLKEQNSIIGFEVNTKADQELSGFTMIGIGKHTIYAYCSDAHETPRLILFPSLEKLFDSEFELLDLQVIKKRFDDSSFRGIVLGSGKLKDLVKDLTPPERQVDIPASVVAAMAEHMSHAQTGGTVPVTDASDAEEVPVKVTKEVVVEEPQEFFTEAPPEDLSDDFSAYEEAPDDFSSYEGVPDDFSSYEGVPDDFSSYEGVPDDFSSYEEPASMEPLEDPRSTQLKAQTFGTLSEISEYCSGIMKVNPVLATNLVNRVLQSPAEPERRVSLAVELFCKLFDEKRI